MRSFVGRVCVVTGAGSGIGRATTLALGRLGADVVAVDRDDAAAVETIEHLRDLGGVGAAYQVDVRDRDAVDRLAAEVEREHGGVALLMNNAGVMARPSEVDHLPDEGFDLCWEVNVRGVVNGTRAFLPQLRQQPEAHIVTVSSVLGLVGGIGFSHYAASKFAVRGFTESLRLDLMSTRIGVTQVHPGPVATHIVDNASGYTAEERAEAGEALRRRRHSTPEQAAAAILHGVRRNRARVLIGSDAVAMDLVARLAPGGYARLLHPLMRRMLAADHVQDEGGVVGTR